MKSTSVSQQNLQQIYSLLQEATTSRDSQSQQQVYKQLTSAEQNKQFYLGLTAIAYNESIEVTIRQMAMLTLKSALRRNESVVDFGEQDLAQMRGIIIGARGGEQDRVIGNVGKSLVSMMALWGKEINFEILGYLLQEVDSEDERKVSWALETLKIIFQDIKFETQNITCFSRPEFSQFVTHFTQQFTTKIKTSPPQITNKYLTIMNLLVKYTHAHPHPQLPHQYLGQFLVPLLANSQGSSAGVPEFLVETVLEGVVEIVEVSPQVVLASQKALQVIMGYHSQSAQITKKWLSLVYDIACKDSEEQKIKPYLPTLTPKIIHNLVYTKQDQLNVKMQQEQQSNPYQYQLQEEDQQQSNPQSHNLLGYTRRKLAVMILKELFTWHTEVVWGISSGYLEKIVQSGDLVERECAMLMVGIVYEISEEHLDFLAKVVPLVIANFQDAALPAILRCTSLWALGKIAYLIVREQTLNTEIQSQLIKCLKNSQGQVRDTVYATLDQFVRCDEQLPRNISSLTSSIVDGIRECHGKTLYSVLKICSTLYQRHPKQIPDQITDAILKQLCVKWSQHWHIESIMSPILECLVTISSSCGELFNAYAFEIFKQAFKILQNEHQKTVGLRAIDLLSSIIATNNAQVNETLRTNPQLHKKLLSLLTNQQNQIRNFTYGLLGDITKVIQIPQFAETYIQTIGSSFNESSLTSCSNALTCLTDLIVRHPLLGGKYGKDVMVMALKKINVNNLQSVYGFNFARIYGRLGNVCAGEGAQLLGDNLRQICIFLRAQEQQKLTDQAYRGIFAMVQQNPQGASKHFEYLVQSFLCYPCQDKQVQQTFLALLKSYRQSLNSQQWHNFIANPLFLPAVVKRIEALSSS